MKKTIVLISIFLISINFLFASHLSGGEITSRNIGGLTYEVKLTLLPATCFPGNYTLLTGFNYSDSSGSWSVFHTGHYLSCMSLSNGLGKYFFIDTITFPSPSFYNVYFNECCKTYAVNNMTGVSLYVNNIIYADPTNSSPYLLNDTIFTAQLGDTFKYNPLAFDPDGDSLIYSVETPLISLGNGDPTYFDPPSDPSLPYSINALSGQMTWIPNTLGRFEIMILVKEYRNGSLIGTIEIDIPLGIIPPTTLNSIENNKIGFSISPNPTNSTFTLTTNTPLTNPQIEIYNTMGAIVYTPKIKGSGANFSKQINLNTPAGIYFVKLSDGERQWAKKLVVE